ncbi:MAG: T9SS type A sorting domain-containing protein [Prolixibacteraceae bacterium]
MKRYFTYSKVMKQSWMLIFILISFTSLPAFAQTKHTVEVGDFYFSPRQLEIEVGDTVEWIHIEGDHNINGSLTAYPENPEYFQNENEEGTEVWPFIHVFRTPGTYHYRCDAHLSEQLGEIIVLEATNVPENDAAQLKIFPNPATEKFWLETGHFKPHEIELSLFDITGKLHSVRQKYLNNKIEFNISHLKQGIYLVELKVPDDRKMLKLVKR